MASLPTIPTSFVPHNASVERRQFQNDFAGIFSLFAYTILVLAFFLAVGVFFYGRYLTTQEATKETQLANVEKKIDPATINEFVRLRDRLDSSQTLLNNHVAFSSAFSALETLVPANVRFTTLHIAIDPSGSAKVEGAGAAKTFNALAAASNVFANDSRIKSAIFSKITVNQDSTVSFGFSAGIDPKVLVYDPTVSVPSAGTSLFAPTPTPTPTLPATPSPATTTKPTVKTPATKP